jgi:hypothetical protein
MNPTSALSAQDIRDSITEETAEILKFERVYFPSYLSASAVAFDFSSRYITNKGTPSVKKRKFHVSIWEETKNPGTVVLLVTHQNNAGSPVTDLLRRNLDADALNAGLVSICP